MTKQKAPAAGNDKGPQKHSHSNDSADQRRRLMARLRLGPVTTIEARSDLDIMMPAARIFELRMRGHRIDTVWTEQATECGKVHRVALYVLRKGAKAEGEPKLGGASARPLKAA